MSTQMSDLKVTGSADHKSPSNPKAVLVLFSHVDCGRLNYGRPSRISEIISRGEQKLQHSKSQSGTGVSILTN